MPNSGMDAIGADKNVRLVDLLRSGLPIGEAGPHAVIILLKADELQPAPDIVVADAVANGAEQEKLKLTAVDRILWPMVSSRETPLFTMDELAEFVAEIEPTRSDAGLRESFADSKLGQFADRGRLQIDADAKRRRIAHGLVHTDRYSGLMQAERKAQPADAASNNDDVKRLHRAATRGSLTLLKVSNSTLRSSPPIFSTLRI